MIERRKCKTMNEVKLFGNIYKNLQILPDLNQYLPDTEKSVL